MVLVEFVLLLWDIRSIWSRFGCRLPRKGCILALWTLRRKVSSEMDLEGYIVVLVRH